MLDILLLSQIASSVLAPAMPYLARGGQKAADEIGGKLGSEAWDAAKALWSRLGSRIEERPLSKEAAEELALSPEDTDAQATFRLQVAYVGY